jgi:diguanylate cyclase (GGDEF)-like protein
MTIKDFFSFKNNYQGNDSLVSFRLQMLKITLLTIFFFTLTFAFLDLFGIHVLGFTVRCSDFIMSAIALLLLFALKRSIISYHLTIYLLVTFTFILFAIILISVENDTSRLMWFAILITITFMLHDIKFALIMTLLSLLLIIISFFATDLHINNTSIVTALTNIFATALMFYFYASRINGYEEKLLKQNQALDKLAGQDYLTGIKNRRLFLEMADQYLHSAKRNNTNFYFLMLDIDHFKKINDTYGHKMGDEVLKGFTKRITSTLRDNDIFGRLGGEEFGVAIMDNDPQKSLIVAEKIRKAVEDLRFNFEEEEIHITASIGIACSEHFQTIETLMTHADEMMYEAKKMGRNKVYSDSLLPLN